MKIAELEAFEKDTSIRSISSLVGITERECEISVSSLLNSNYLSAIEGFVTPKTQFALSDYGLERLEEVKLSQPKESKPVSIEESRDTHVWYRMGDYGSGSGQITKDKWYPMGSICNK